MKISIEAFRGINTPFSIGFDKHANLTIIYGENGSGKTTISDALDFVFHGSPGSLQEKSLDGKGRIPALVHAQRNNADLSVTWENKEHKRTAKLSGSKADLSGSTGAKLHTLSRKNITSLIEETPAKRFTRIQEFVEVPQLEREENELREFIRQQKQLQESEERAANQYTEDLNALHMRHTEGLDPRPELNDWGRKILSDSPDTIQEHLEIFNDLNHQITRLRNDFNPLKASYGHLTDAEVKHNEEQEKLNRLVEESTDDFSDALRLLEEASALFSRKHTDTCPVCDRETPHAELTDKVSVKLSRLKTITQQSKAARAAQTRLEQTRTALSTQQGNFYAIIDALRKIHTVATENETWDTPPLIPSLLSPEQAEHLDEEWFTTLTEEASRLKTLSTFVEDQLTKLQAQQQIQTQLKDILARKKDTSKEHEDLGKLSQKATLIADILHSERIEHANQTLASISEDFAELYRTIHPQEDLEKIKLYLHPTRKGSALFEGRLFGNTGVTPVACLSESHLDTLGLCLFLALQKKSNPSDTILYLDDAIASVDEAHMERLYNLLLDQACHFKHVIITSHYQPLRFKFRWGILTQKKVNFVELGQWSLDCGITLAKGPNSEISLLRKYIEAKDDPSTIAGKSGIILEQILDFLTGIYHCRLPRHPGAEQRWTLDNYKSGIQGNKKLFEALRCDHLDSDGNITDSFDLDPLLKDVFDMLQFRNAIGCHYKELAGQFNELTEAVKLGEATLALVHALCDEDDELPSSAKDGISWANRGTITRRLSPLNPPQ